MTGNMHSNLSPVPTMVHKIMTMTHTTMAWSYDAEISNGISTWET